MKKLNVKREFSDDEGQEEPLSPQARVYLAPRLTLPIVAIVGFKTRVDVGVMIDGLKNTLINHPRFCSKVVVEDRKEGKMKWVRTTVNVEDHIIVPDLDPKIENPDQFVEDYISNLTRKPMDHSKPLWDFHILNVETSEGEAVGVFRINHAIGDGASLIALLLACTRKTSDPEALPSLPVQKRSKPSGVTSGSFFWWLVMYIWTLVRLIWNTARDLVEFVGTITFFKDTKTPLLGEYEDDDDPQHTPMRRFVHTTVSLDDIKLVAKAMNVTINDVLVGATQAGLSLYLNRSPGNGMQNREENRTSHILPKSYRSRALVIFNLRSVGIQASADMMAKGSDVGWGNKIGYAFIPLKFALQNDPLDYIREAKSKMDRKKNSFAASGIGYIAAFISKAIGDKTYAEVTRSAFANTTITFSNVVGPTEEICFYGHPITFLASAGYGLPQALTVHFQSYVKKMTMVLGVDTNVIPDPHNVCDDIEESLQIFVDSVVARGLVKDS